MGTSNKERSIWATGAIIAIVPTILSTIGAAGRYADTVGPMFCLIIYSFVFWWLVCSFLVWAYRKIARK